MERLKGIVTILLVNIIAVVGYLAVSIPINFHMNEPCYCRPENFPRDFAIGMPVAYYQFQVDGDVQHGSGYGLLYSVAIPFLLVLVFYCGWWLCIMPAENDEQKRLQAYLKGNVKQQLIVAGVPVFMLTGVALVALATHSFMDDYKNYFSLTFSLLLLYVGHIVIYRKYDALERKSLEMKDEEDEDDTTF